MKKIFITSFWILIIVLSFPQSKPAEIKFIVHCPPLSDSEFVYISGNSSQLGEWDPSSVQLDKLNDSTYSKTFLFETGTSIEYKFTRGSWDNEALNEDGLIPENSLLKITGDTIIITHIKKWKTAEKRISHGQITGNVQFHLNFQVNGLKSRDIIVWLPPSYNNKLMKRYPVLYMHDGQNIIDPATSSFGYDWCVDEAADSLIKADIINEIIIVGIYNTPDRWFEYSYSPLGYKYMDFIVSKLKPFIDSAYRTLSDNQNTDVCGSSMGGLISFMMAWNYPEVFSKAACLSPAFQIRELNYVDSIFNFPGEKKNIHFYIDNGGIDLDSALQPGVDLMIAALQSKGYELGKDIIWFTDKNAKHFESAWAERIWRPLVYFFGKNKDE